MTNFEALLLLLAKEELEFIVVGGAAATAHGSARLTKDLDIVYRRTPQIFAASRSAWRPTLPISAEHHPDSRPHWMFPRFNGA
ncbi:MAG: hypothetical protein ACRD24_11320 [Terriglobales bacterium]